MSDPLRTDGSRAHADAASDADRDAKIEQLLLVGLDHYFAAQLRAGDQRLDARAVPRPQPRAGPRLHRAGAQRAGRAAARVRGAAAERRRRVRARRGRRGAAPAAGRDRRRRAVRRGAGGSRSPEPARDRRGAAPRRRARIARAASGRPARRADAAALAGPHGRRRRRGRCWRRRCSRSAGVAAWNDVIDWRSLVAFARIAGAHRTGRRPCRRRSAREASLPLPRRGEIALTRARALAAGGHLRDALAALDAVRPTDPQQPDADRLRADIQRQLLALTPLPAGGSPDREKGERRSP